LSPRYGNSINSAEYIFDARVPTGLDIRYLSGVPTSPAQLCGPASYSNIGQAGSFTAITRGLRTSNYTALMYAHRVVAKRDLLRAALTSPRPHCRVPAAAQRSGRVPQRHGGHPQHLGPAAGRL